MCSFHLTRGERIVFGSEALNTIDYMGISNVCHEGTIRESLEWIKAARDSVQ